MISSYTQTYSNNRKELFDFHSYDTVDINFRNKLDNNYYVFHNSPEDYTQSMCNKEYFKKINNMEIISYNNISYTESFLKTLNKCKTDGVKYLFFLQDDAFSLVNDNIIDELLLFVKNNSFDMLNIEFSYSALNSQEPLIYSGETLQIYDTTSDDFAKKEGVWAFDDGPYVANVDFLINKLYDSTYLSKNDIWNAEWYIKEKVQKNKIQRLTPNISIFRRFGIVGPNASVECRERDLPILNKFLENNI